MSEGTFCRVAVHMSFLLQASFAQNNTLCPFIDSMESLGIHYTHPHKTLLYTKSNETFLLGGVRQWAFLDRRIINVSHGTLL